MSAHASVTLADLDALDAEAEAHASGEHLRVASALPVIQVSVDTDRVVREATAALTRAKNTYARGGVLSRVVQDHTDKRIKRDDGAPTIRGHTAATLDRELSTVACFQRYNAKREEWAPCPPPRIILSALLDAGAWPGVRPLVGVASAPVLRADGTIAQAPGYDEASGVLLAFDASSLVNVPDRPTREDARDARDALLALVSDFPFATAADRSAWLALPLTLLARTAIDGPCPMWIVTANVRGCGKSRLIDVAAIVATGREAARATQPNDDAEAGKLITSIVLAGDDLLLLDNVDRPLASSKLDALLTGGRWKDRVLGVNVTTDLPIRVVVAVTGNNVEVWGDTQRRVLPVRLDSPHEHPEARTDFAIRDLLAHARRDRPRLVACALTILRAWYVARCPRDDGRTWGSYEAWAALVPHVLRWIDIPDPQDTRVDIEADDPRRRALAVVLASWPTLQSACGRPGGLTIREAIAWLYPKGQAREHTETDELRAALETLAPGRGAAQVDARTLGHVFKRERRRMLGGRRLVQTGTDEHSGVVRWTVQGASEASLPSDPRGGHPE